MSLVLSVPNFAWKSSWYRVPLLGRKCSRRVALLIVLLPKVDACSVVKDDSQRATERRDGFQGIPSVSKTARHL